MTDVLELEIPSSQNPIEIELPKGAEFDTKFYVQITCDDGSEFLAEIKGLLTPID